MFTLRKTVETPGGLLKTVVHDRYECREEAQRIADNLRLLYPWVKHTEVREEKQMAASVRRGQKRLVRSVN